MQFRDFRKLSLKSFIIFLCLSALIAIVVVLSGDLGELEIKILVTTFSVSACSICCMACAAYIERKRIFWAGIVGIVLAVAGTTLGVAGMWIGSENEVFFKIVGSLVTLAVCSVHYFLLALPVLHVKNRWVQTAAGITIALLALMIIAAIWGEIKEDGYYKLLGVVSIIVVLETVTIPILFKLRNRPPVPEKRTEEVLTLRKIQGGLYKDNDGNSYRVTKV